MRWLMISSPALTGQDLRVDKHGKDMKETVRLAIKPIWNAYNFFCLYANSDGIKAERYFTDLTLKIGNNKKLVKDAQKIREEVFQKGQHVSKEDDIDGHDHDHDKLHYVLYKSGEPIGTMRIWLKDDAGASFQRFAILQEYRGKGIGRYLFQQVMLDLAKKPKIKHLTMHAQAYLENFYREFGFESFGDKFEQAGITHMEMKRPNLTKTEMTEFAKENFLRTSGNLMDIYILSKLKSTVQSIEKAMDDYNPQQATKESEAFFEVLNNWYIRRCRNRFWKSEIDQDKQDAYDTLYTCLLTMCEAIAPLMPFTTEEIWKGLSDK
jgi:predicted GNAT family N-acyltransferase